VNQATFRVGDRAPGLDVAFAGMGLANALAAVRIATTRPELHIAGFDTHAAVGAGRTWSFFGPDVTPAQLDWLRPLLRREWPAYEVRFPGFRRVVHTSMCTLSGPALGRALTGLTRAADISEVAPDRLTLADGGSVAARVVLDGRGARPSAAFRCGWQKFLGQELRLTAPHGLRHPILMDAAVEQLDGFRFIYILPYGPDRLLVEDTRYSDTPDLSLRLARDEITAYIAAQGWRVAEQFSEERGVLPVVLDGDIDAFWSEVGPVPPLGMRAGLFHPVTGYSLPSAVALADALALCLPARPEALRRMIEERARATWQAQGFYRVLNRMLFLAGNADQRWRVFARFFALPQPLIERFFAGRTSALDRMRLVTGRPPVPFFSALRCIPSSRQGESILPRPAPVLAGLLSRGARADG
jgi:lycopene beta-cyclase